MTTQARELQRPEKRVPGSLVLPIPTTLQGALDPQWLGQVLTPISGGRAVVSVELSELIRTMASKARIAVRFEGDPSTHHLCLKAFLDNDEAAALGGITTLREAEFYRQIAPQLTMRTPPCVAIAVDHAAGRGILIMADLIAAGARFCSALDSFSVIAVQQTLDQIARLHARSDLLHERDWIPCRVEMLAQRTMFPAERLQPLMHDARRGNLPARTLDASLLLAGIKALATRNAAKPQTLLHGDCHAGNLYWTTEGPGFSDWQLIQRGNWALDVAYHIASLLPADVAEREERALLDGYLDALARHGGAGPDHRTAWDDYRCAQIYGYYHWAITSKVDPAITSVAFQRLGAGVTRHDSYRLLGL